MMSLLESQPQPFVFETRIRFIDTDASGRIHYTCMFRYYESAEIEFMRTIGVTYRMADIAFPRVHVECDYQLALFHDDLIRIEVLLTKIGKSSVKFNFRTLKDHVLAASGSIVVACMDRATQQSVPIPNELRAKLTSVLHQTENT